MWKVDSFSSFFKDLYSPVAACFKTTELQASHVLGHKRLKHKNYQNSTIRLSMMVSRLVGTWMRTVYESVHTKE